VNYKEMRSTNEPKNSAKIRERVIRARQKQLERFASSRQKLYCNAQMSSRHIGAFSNSPLIANACSSEP
jgi:predicted ATPase with chaperone activity